MAHARTGGGVGPARDDDAHRDARSSTGRLSRGNLWAVCRVNTASNATSVSVLIDGVRFSMAESSSAVCAACGDVVSAHRLVNHETYWCSALPSRGSDSGDECSSAHDEQMQRVREIIAGVRSALEPGHECESEDAEPTPEPAPEPALERQAEEPTAARVAGWGSKLQSMATVSLLGLPVTLRFEQQSVFGETSTGGALWRAELLLAEWCIRELRGSPGWVIELGCGVAPAAGLACAALGCDVVFTDLLKVLPLTEANLRLNANALSQARADASATPLSRASCDTVAFEFSATLPPRLDALVQQTPGRPGMILCSDCLVWLSLHDPLALAIRSILESAAAAAAAAAGNNSVGHTTRCAVAYQRRSDDDELFFTQSCPAHGLRCETSCVEELLKSNHFAELSMIGDQLGKFLFVEEIMLVG